MKRSDLRNIIKEVIQEENEYQNVVRQVMDIIGIDSPRDLDDAKRAKFFSYLDAIWDKSAGKKRKEPDEEAIKAIMGEAKAKKNKEKDEFKVGKKTYKVKDSVNEDLSQKDLAKQLKTKFGGTYKIQGLNIFIKNPNSSAEDILSFIEKLNKDDNLGYKRFFVKDKGSKKLIGSVPFGIAITINESVNEGKKYKTLDDFEKVAKIGNVFYLGNEDQFKRATKNNYYKVVGKKSDGTLVINKGNSKKRFTIGPDMYDDSVILVKESVKSINEGKKDTTKKKKKYKK